MQGFISQLNDLFALKDLGNIHLFLGIEALCDDTNCFTQSKYTEEILKRNNMDYAKPCPKPTVIEGNLIVEDREELIDPDSLPKDNRFPSILDSHKARYIIHCQ